MGKIKDLTGSKFGYLTVLGRSPNGWSSWQCRCVCNKIIRKTTFFLEKGVTKSCGCMQHTSRKKELTKGEKLAKNSWKSMISRCYCKTNKDYHLYGARGITVHSSWRNSFDQFLQDMGPRERGLTIDRIDSNGDYSPENCRWATIIDQNNNRRSNRHVTFNGKTQTISQWSREIGIGKNVIKDRLNRGYSDEEALTAPLSASSIESLTKLWVFEGEAKTIKEWSEELNTTSKRIREKMNLGSSFEDVVKFFKGADKKFLHRCERCRKIIPNDEIENKLAHRFISEDASEYTILCAKHNPFDQHGNKKENFNMKRPSRPVNQLDKKSLEIINTFPSIAEAARTLFPKCKHASGDISKAISYKRVCKGFMWSLADVADTEEETHSRRVFTETIPFDKDVLDQIWRALFSYSSLLSKNNKDNESVLALMAKIQAKYSVRNG